MDASSWLRFFHGFKSGEVFNQISQFSTRLVSCELRWHHGNALGPLLYVVNLQGGDFTGGKITDA